MQLNQNLNLSIGNSHILTFDEKIIRYKQENEKDLKVELLPTIFNNKQELLIKPISKHNNKLIVYTASKTYNLNIYLTQNNSELSGQKDALSETAIIDMPQVLPEKVPGMVYFELDNPPKLKK